jgi:UDP-N-acetyl-D-glucosamine dehydrogenase
VLVLGVAYKPDVADTRETPAAKLMELLRSQGAEVVYHDPHVPSFRLGRELLESVELSEAVLGECHCVVIVTAATRSTRPPVSCRSRRQVSPSTCQ